MLNLRIPTSSWRNEAIYFAIFNVTNVLNYVYLVFVGFFLGADSYGLFGALFGIVYLASSLGNMVKMAVARHVATVQAQNGGVITRQVVMGGLAWSGAFAGVVGLVLMLAVPLIANAFDSPTAPVAWSCLAITLSIWVPAAYGVLQGMERFPSLGTALFVAAFVRFAAGGALVAAGAGVAGAMAGVVLGFAASAVYALVLCFRQVGEHDDSRPWIRVPAPRLSALAAVLVASLVVAAPTSLDVAVVRHIFSGQEAGAYTGIAVLGRVIIFASIAVPFTILPKVAVRTASGKPTGGLLVQGLAMTGSLAVAAAAAIAFAVDVMGWQLGGIDVSSAGAALHWYLAAMVLFSLTVTMIYYQVGRGNATFILAAGVPCIALQAILVALIADSLTAVAQVIFVLDAGLLLAGGVFALAGERTLSSSKRSQTVATVDKQPGGAGEAARWPNFFIVGAPRAGTTSLYHYLRGHPDIFMPHIKEPHFFSGVNPGSERLRYARSRPTSSEKEYLALFRGVRSETEVGEASPSYLQQPDAPRRIKEKAPDAKIIIILREPVDRAFSQYLADYREGAQTLPFYEALVQDLANPRKEWGPAHLYTELGMYHDQVVRYLETFGRDQVRIYLYEDLSRDPSTIVEDVCNFLGVSFNEGRFFDAKKRFNTYAAPRSRLAQRVMGLATLRSFALSIVPVTLLMRLRNAILLTKTPKPAMDADARELLSDLYQRDIEGLQEIIGRDLGPWLRGQAVPPIEDGLSRARRLPIDTARTAIASPAPRNGAVIEASILSAKQD